MYDHWYWLRSRGCATITIFAVSSPPADTRWVSRSSCPRPLPPLPRASSLYFLSLWAGLFQAGDTQTHPVRPFVPASFHLACCVSGSLTVTLCHDSIPLQGWMTISCVCSRVLFIHLSADGHWLVPSFGLLGIMLPCTVTRMCSSPAFKSSGCLYLGVGLLDHHMVILR